MASEKTRTICLTDREATLAAQGKLGALLRVIQPRKGEHIYDYIKDYDPNDPAYGPFCEDENGVYHPTAKLAPFAPGQKVGLKESWAEHADGLDTGDGTGHLFYRADFPEGHPFSDGKWRSPVTMPAWAIRHRPTVLSVSAEQAGNLSPWKVIELGVCSNAWMYAYRIEPSTWVWFATVDWRTE